MYVIFDFIFIKKKIQNDLNIAKSHAGTQFKNYKNKTPLKEANVKLSEELVEPLLYY